MRKGINREDRSSGERKGEKRETKEGKSPEEEGKRRGKEP